MDTDTYPAKWDEVARIAARHAQEHHANITSPWQALLRLRELGLLDWRIKASATHTDSIQHIRQQTTKGDASYALILAMHQLVLGMGILLKATPLGQAILKLAAENNLFCAAVSEKDTYSNDINSAEPGMPATPTTDGSGFVLAPYGPYEKFPCTGIKSADYVLVSCKNEANGKAMFALVPTNAPGLTITKGKWRPSGARATVSEGIIFNGVRVPRERTMEVDPFVPTFLLMGILAYGYYTAVTAQLLLDLLQWAKDNNKGGSLATNKYLAEANEAMELLIQAAKLHDQSWPHTKEAVTKLLDAKRRIGFLAREVCGYLWPLLGLRAKVMYQAPDATGEGIEQVRKWHDLAYASGMPPSAEECERLLADPASLPGVPG